MNLKKIIAQQKAQSRKVVAAAKIAKKGISAEDERWFLDCDFSKVKTLEDLMDIVHATKHCKLSKAHKHTRCKLCKTIIAEIQQDILPKFGNLISVLEKEVATEKAFLESKNLPTQNDLTRWALKDAVLAYYQGFQFPIDKPIVESREDNRLIDELAPDFDKIAKIWFVKLDELKRRNDKYTLNEDEFDKAEADLVEKMQGSNFEKQLDRFRIDFMAKLPK